MGKVKPRNTAVIAMPARQPAISSSRATIDGLRLFLEFTEQADDDSAPEDLRLVRSVLDLLIAADGGPALKRSPTARRSGPARTEFASMLMQGSASGVECLPRPTGADDCQWTIAGECATDAKAVATFLALAVDLVRAATCAPLTPVRATVSMEYDRVILDLLAEASASDRHSERRPGALRKRRRQSLRQLAEAVCVSATDKLDCAATFTLREHGASMRIAVRVRGLVDTPVALHPRRSTERLLIVEDDPRQLRLTARLLEGAGLAVTACRSAEEAIAALTKIPREFSLVLADVVMPAIDGAALARRLAEVRPDLPVILMTASASHAVALQAASIEVLVKPIVPRDLLLRIRTSLDEANGKA